MLFQMNNLWIVFVVTLLATLIFMPVVITYFKNKQLGQTTRDEGPKWHEVKSGTPTMGGVVFLITSSLASLIFGFLYDQLTISMILTLGIILIYGFLGFIDDYIKLILKRNLGLTSKQKFLGQVVGGVLFFLIYKLNGLSTSLYIPFIGEVQSDLIFGIVLVVWLVGFSNAVNLTDGLDGLVAGTGSIAYAAYGYLAYTQERWDLVIIAVAVVAGLLGFFVFNKKPAKIFMGDVGSLALGGGLAALSVLLESGWSLLFIGIIFVIETASVMLQVASFKLRGKRIFRMSPIHHHFEMVGWHEWKIVIVFWTIGLIAAVLTLQIIV